VSVTPRLVAADHPGVVALACEALERGGLIIYPTDTLYALGGKALDARVAEQVRAAKGRSESLPLPVVAADWRQAARLARSLPAGATRLAERFWPGPLTLVFPAAADVPAQLTSSTGTVAVRVPALALLREICAQAGPLIATSANRSGERAATTCDEALSAVGEHALLAVDGGPARGSMASTIVDLTGERARLARAGAVEWREVLEALGQDDPR
jgi:L-threonylcarbamoyladenylate synthase